MIWHAPASLWLHCNVPNVWTNCSVEIHKVDPLNTKWSWVHPLCAYSLSLCILLLVGAPGGNMFWCCIPTSHGKQRLRIGPGYWLVRTRQQQRRQLDFIFMKQWWLTSLQIHTLDYVIKWKHFQRYWPFVRGIHQSPVNSPHKASDAELWLFSLICARQRLSKQSRCRWFETPSSSLWRHFNAHALIYLALWKCLSLLTHPCSNELNVKLTIIRRRHMVPWIWVGIGSSNGLSPIQRQSITRTNADVLPIGPPEASFKEISINIT